MDGIFASPSSPLLFRGNCVRQSAIHLKYLQTVSPTPSLAVVTLESTDDANPAPVGSG